MERLYKEYKYKIEFVIVYIREAHPEMLKDGNETGVVGRPKDIDERIILATECVTRYKFTMPMVIDGMEGNVNSDYEAAPVRVTITDREGKVAYYAGRGPFDFRLSKVEQVLKKLTANDGIMPPAPPPVWGEPVNGLRFGLSLDPPNPMPEEDVSILMAFENVQKEPLYLYYSVSHPLTNLAVRNSRGQTLNLESQGGQNSPSRRMRGDRGGYRIFPQEIAAGSQFQTDIDAKFPALEDPKSSAGEGYRARFTFEVTEEMVEPIRRYRDWPYWQGRVSSGAFDFAVTAPNVQTCMDCHGVPDYHHVADLDCSRCHTGKEGTPEFAVNKDACSGCHPRDGIQGRRMIGKTKPASPPYTVHVAGTVQDAICLKCHDPEHHQEGNVRLIDPFSNRGSLWTDSETEFCLCCHGGEPPWTVSFPASTDKSYDQSAFLNHPLFLEGKACTDCHTTHGSRHRPLLREEGLESPHN
jgi:predicted CXXCH cytochrome family protein